MKLLAAITNRLALMGAPTGAIFVSDDEIENIVGISVKPTIIDGTHGFAVAAVTRGEMEARGKKTD